LRDVSVSSTSNRRPVEITGRSHKILDKKVDRNERNVSNAGAGAWAGLGVGIVTSLAGLQEYLVIGNGVFIGCATTLIAAQAAAADRFDGSGP
jgi:hypothetical protein